MPKLFLFNKPFQVMSQFSACDDKVTLARYISTPKIYPAGRLDYDSEGLLLLTDDGPLQARIAEPRFKLPKDYLVQVEGQISEEALEALRSGVPLKDGMTKPAQAKKIPAPDIGPRVPPIRERTNIPTSWVKLSICEGKNRQVRRMTAHVGYPTLRLIRYSIGPWSIAELAPGECRQISVNLPGSARKSQSNHRTNKNRSGTKNKRNASSSKTRKH